MLTESTLQDGKLWKSFLISGGMIHFHLNDIKLNILIEAILTYLNITIFIRLSTNSYSKENIFLSFFFWL